MIEDDDELWRTKMGRVSEWDARIAERLFRLRRRRQASSLSPRAFAWRTRHADRSWRLNDGPQVVVKAAGSRKSRSGVYACVRYVARLRTGDDTPARTFDQFGRELSPEQVMRAVKAWDLEADGDNLSAAARRGGAEGLGERRRLRNVQAWHFVLSVVADKADAEALLRAAAATVDAAFARVGHRAIWALHTDCPGRPHVHVVVKAVSEFGGRLRCDIHGDLFDNLRCEFAAALSLAGLRFQAARREDRADVRVLIVTGQERLRPVWHGRGDGDLVRRAPAWFGRFGVEYVERLKGVAEEVPQKPRWWQVWRREPKPAPQPRIPPAYAEAFAECSSLYRDPARALGAWQWLAVEGARMRPSGEAVFPNRRLAEWYATHRPEYFGALLPGAKPGKALRGVLRAARLPIPAPAPMPRIEPAVVQDVTQLRWRRQVDRDRKGVVRSLERLAAIALQRFDDEGMAERLLRRLDADLSLPIGAAPPREADARPMVERPTPARTAPSRPLPARPEDRPAPEPAPASAAPSRPAPQPTVRRVRRGSMER
ncbi:relaxase/mobilization nuclease domain-containing protein [Magnetospirillum sp. UT-4]|uniref:relaxase/mobilization nuclease domain-containing protein n=1 Tax=Magnetospirillum sp. UT-4 TaxID=2681467 RepID=UPI00137F7675|nr:hypothetical protein [Magnetospirillum sp. UT-4]CAA7625036.1 conserved hypothetical protein [Magnetospirillum sp. UT-4]